MLTKDERAVLAHIVLDPEAWYSHAVKTLGEAGAEAALQAKVRRWRSEYETAAASPNYKTRLQREAVKGAT